MNAMSVNDQQQQQRQRQQRDDDDRRRHRNERQRPEPLCELRVADSIFLGYVFTHSALPAIERHRRALAEAHHPDAAHVPYAASLGAGGDEEGKEGYDDDGEPTGSRVGMTLLRELNLYKKRLRRQSTVRIRGGSGSNGNDAPFESDDEEADESRGVPGGDADSECDVATAIVVVRYFEKRLLGVTCGRLRGLYERTAKLALHRHLNGSDAPFAERYSFGGGNRADLYGLGAGDAELILDVVPRDALGDEGEEEGENADGRNDRAVVLRLLRELKWEGMVGSDNEPLPRLQCLQADLPVVGNGRDPHRNSFLVPAYRYPGNYSGTEWPTHPWSLTTLKIKRSAEEALRPLYVQRMNHCVANLYRDGSDRIDRHSDKDLDLNREGVIVSVSTGSARVLELRDREHPHDAARVELPPGSMFVLGPYTNARFTHAMLPTDAKSAGPDAGKGVGLRKGAGDGAGCSVEGGGRISLTFRDVRTFLDVKSQRLFGQGVESSSSTPILSEDGVVTEESLARAVQAQRDDDKREKNGALLVSVAIGAAVGRVAFGSDGGSGRAAARSAGSDPSNVLRGAAAAAISTSATYWYLRRTRRRMRHAREEREARAFFSKMSASGNRY